jgi:hypothetical protein
MQQHLRSSPKVETIDVRFLDVYCVFYEGINAFQLAKKCDSLEDRSTLIATGELSIASFETWAKVFGCYMSSIVVARASTFLPFPHFTYLLVFKVEF